MIIYLASTHILNEIFINSGRRPSIYIIIDVGSK